MPVIAPSWIVLVVAACVGAVIVIGRRRLRREGASAAPTGKREMVVSMEERRLWGRLLSITLGDEHKAEALVKQAERYALGTDRADRLKAAIRLWEDDNR